MKKSAILFSMLMPISTFCFSATLHSMDKTQIKKIFVNHTLSSIPTDNLNGKTINNTFSMFMNDKGDIFGKMSIKPVNEPQELPELIDIV